MMRLTTLPALLAGLTPFAVIAEDALLPVDQHTITQMVQSGQGAQAFMDAFEIGDELTEHSFDAARGVGANIGEGRRFSRFPRADLTGPMEWANHFPEREGGANATSCIACHNAPFDNGAGDVALNVILDPAHTGDPSKYLERNTLPLFALGIPQRLAEEISVELYLQRDAARAGACETGDATAQLSAKGIDYGLIRFTRIGQDPCKLEMDASQLDGIDADLVIKPFGWKGNHATIRAFTRGAAHNELGLQAVELVGSKDGDFDGVTHELTVGDLTALTVYMAALERPVSLLELDEIGLMSLTPIERENIVAGRRLFTQTGCASCHTLSMTFEDTVFKEPSTVAGFFDVVFPDGSDPRAQGLDAMQAVSFDLSADQPNNMVTLPEGGIYHLGVVEHDAKGAAFANWYTDFKRHDMGAQLSDPSDPLGLGASKFLTRSLAGVGSTGPWLHDGRATTLHEAIETHGGAAAASRDQYVSLSDDAQAQIVAFLENLVIYKSDTPE